MKHLFRLLISLLALLIIGSTPCDAQKNRKPYSKGRVFVDDLLARDTSFKKMVNLAELSKNEKDSFLNFNAKILDNLSINTKRYFEIQSKYYQDYFIGSNINTDLDEFEFLTKEELKVYKGIKVIAKASEGSVIDICVANRSESTITIYDDNFDRLNNYLVLKGLENDIAPNYAPYYLFIKQFIADETYSAELDRHDRRINLLKTTELQDSLLKYLAEKRLIEISHFKIVHAFIFLHEFAHIYLNTQDEIIADEFAYNHLAPIFERIEGNYKKFYFSKGISDLFQYMYYEYELTDLANNSISQRSENPVSDKMLSYLKFLRRVMKQGNDMKENEIYQMTDEKIKTIERENEKIILPSIYAGEDVNFKLALENLQKGKHQGCIKCIGKAIINLENCANSSDIEPEKSFFYLIIGKIYEIKYQDYENATKYYTLADKLPDKVFEQSYYTRLFERINQEKENKK